VKPLLDTHAFIWLDGEPARLSAHARAGIWELQIKLQLGKLALRGDLASILSEQQQTNHLHLLAIELPDILNLATLPAHHRDPFDRLLVSQAQRGGLELVTHDPEISKYPVRILWD
jgi:PIN domain nuclease of toxin-antitoxin system